jgi:peptidoglycan hydrolase CwlO-like protein
MIDALLGLLRAFANPDDFKEMLAQLGEQQNSVTAAWDELEKDRAAFEERKREFEEASGRHFAEKEARFAAEREELHRETTMLRQMDVDITEQKRAALDAERAAFKQRVDSVVEAVTAAQPAPSRPLEKIKSAIA